MFSKQQISFSLSLPNISNEQPNTSTNQQMPSQIHPSFQSIEIKLTLDDLLSAGYQTKKTLWTEEEDKRLMELFQKKKLGWDAIAQRMPGRTSKMCYSRFRRLSNKLKDTWTDKQNSLIQGLVPLLEGNWKRISEYFPKRKAKQIQDHYENYLRPEINKSPWTLEEDLLLIDLLKKYGKDWNWIEKQLKGRTQCQIKNRFYGRLKRIEEKKQRKYSKQMNTYNYE